MYLSKEKINILPKKLENEESTDSFVDKRTRNEVAHGGIKFEKEKRFTFQGFKVDASRLFGKSDKVLKDIPDENEGSIIFISKNELENMNFDLYSDEESKKAAKKEEEKQKQQEFNEDKMKVFRENNANQPKLSKWFKQLKILRSTERLSDGKSEENKLLDKYREYRDPFDPFSDKTSSMERYQDMSKLIEDRFGATRMNRRIEDLSSERYQSYRSLTTSSDIGVGSSASRPEPKRVLTKSVSVQTGIMDTDDRLSDLGQKKNLSVEQINYYSENDSSLKKKQIYTGNCAKRLEIETGKQKISRFERRQRIRPDLIPEKSDIASTSSFDQIQSCEDLNAFGTGSSRSESNHQVVFSQQSFITEKLCSEFHVKTKRVLSKSTSNLLHGKDKKDPITNAGSKPNLTANQNGRKIAEVDINIVDVIDESIESIEENENSDQGKLKRSISSIQNRKLPVIEDLPYGQVADAISGRGNHERRDSDTSDNIYAEICNPEIKNKSKKEDLISFEKEIFRNTSFINIEADEHKPIVQNKVESKFRHIEVVVIERNPHNLNEDFVDSDFVDSDSDEKISENVSQKYSSLSGSGGFSAGNSLEKENNKIGTNIFSRSDKNHAIRLEVTHNSAYDSEISKSSLDSREENRMPSLPGIRNGSYVKFSQGTPEISTTSIITEAIYSTLK